MARSPEAIAAEYLDKSYRSSVRRNAVTAMAAIGTADSVRRLTRVGLDPEESDEVRTHVVERLKLVDPGLRGEVLAEVKASVADGPRAVTAYALLARLRGAGFGSASFGSLASLRLAWLARKRALAARSRVFLPILRAGFAGTLTSILLCLGALFLLSPSEISLDAVFSLMLLPLFLSLPLAGASLRSTSPTVYLTSTAALIFETLTIAIVAVVPLLVLLFGSYVACSSEPEDGTYALCLMVALAAVAVVRVVSIHSHVPFGRVRSWPRGLLSAAAGVATATLLFFSDAFVGDTTADDADFVAICWLLVCCGLPGLGLALARIDENAPRHRLTSRLVTLAVLAPLAFHLIGALATLRSQPVSRAQPIVSDDRYRTFTRDLMIPALPYRGTIEAGFAQSAVLELNVGASNNRGIGIHLALEGGLPLSVADRSESLGTRVSRRLEPGKHRLEIREEPNADPTDFEDVAVLFLGSLLAPYRSEPAVTPEGRLTLSVVLNVDPEAAVLARIEELLAEGLGRDAVAEYEKAAAAADVLRDSPALSAALCRSDVQEERLVIEAACNRWVELAPSGSRTRLRALDRRASFHAHGGDAERARADLAAVIAALPPESESRHAREQWLAELEAGTVPAAMTQSAQPELLPEAILAWGGFSDLDEEFQNAVDVLEREPDLLIETSTADSFGPEFETSLAGASVLLIPEIEESDPSLSRLASELRPIARRFVEGGGTVVVLGVNEAWTEFLREAGLIDLESAGGAADPVTIEPQGPLAAAVSEGSFSPPNATMSYSPGPDLELWAVDSAGDGVVVARWQGRGLVIAIGMDYFESSEAADEILVAAVTALSGLDLAPPGVEPSAEEVAAAEE